MGVCEKKTSMNTILLGSKYGGWVVPDIFDETSICYFAGVGEDITFDVEFVKRYGSDAYLFDPTPRAIDHFNSVICSAGSDNKISPVPPSLEFPYYEISSEEINKMKIFPIGLGAEASGVTFYPPTDPSHVSHSIVNIQGTSKENGFTAKCDSISNIMNELGHIKIDCLKLDIEGAELAVVDEIISKNIDIGVLCVEFDYSRKYASPPLHYVINSIEQSGLKLISDSHNHTFINTKLLNE